MSTAESRRRMIIPVLVWLGMWWSLVLLVTALAMRGSEWSGPPSPGIRTAHVMSSGDPKPIPPAPSPSPPGQPIPPAPDPPPAPRPIPPSHSR